MRGVAAGLEIQFQGPGPLDGGGVFDRCAGFGVTGYSPPNFVGFFFFSSRRRHTSSLRDWSSDVCSSDLTPAPIVKRMADEIAAIVRTDEVRARLDAMGRSEERRVGKECRCGGSPRGLKYSSRGLGRSMEVACSTGAQDSA